MMAVDKELKGSTTYSTQHRGTGWRTFMDFKATLTSCQDLRMVHSGRLSAFLTITHSCLLIWLLCDASHHMRGMKKVREREQFYV